MAQPADFSGTNIHMGPPPGREDSIGWLHVFANGLCNVSAWRPTQKELEKLNAGEPIFVSVMSGASVDGDGILRPNVYPMFVGCESEVASVVADHGRVWKK